MPTNFGSPTAYPVDWDKTAARVIREEPVCQIQGPKCTIESTECDHIVPIARGGTHARTNLQGVCHKCHSEKTKQEAAGSRSVNDPRVLPRPDASKVTDEIIDAGEHSDWFYSYGPAHEKDEDGNYILPKYTLGWEALAWLMTYMKLKGKLYEPTPEQARFFLWIYAVTDEINENGEDGTWVYERIIKIGPKGSGKDPILALIAYLEMIGPCRFDGWRIDEFGEKAPIARDVPEAEFQIGALSEDQAKITWKYLRTMPTDEAIRKYDIEIPKGPNIFAYGQSRKITALSSTSATKEGELITGAALSEGEHGTKRNGFFGLEDTLRGNVGKSSGARMFYISNAPIIGRNSFTQQQIEEYEDMLNGRKPMEKVMLDGIFTTDKAPYDTIKERIAVMKFLYSDAPWPNYQKQAEEFDSSLSIEVLIAKWYNGIRVDANSWADVRDWDNCPIDNFGLPSDAEVKLPPKGSMIVMSFDGSYNDDCTALRGRVLGGPHHGTSFKIGIWTPPKRKIVNGKREAAQMVNRDEVKAKVDEMFANYKVIAFWGDPSHRTDESDVLYWKPVFDEWHRKYGNKIQRQYWASTKNAINFDMANSTNSSRFVEQLDLTQALITDRQYRHTTDEEVRTHLMNTIRKTKAGYDDHIIGKRSPQSPDKMDFTVTMVIGDIPFTLAASKYRIPTQEGSRS